MRKQAAERMRGILNGTGAYYLTGESPGDWDVNACGAGLDRLETAMDDLISDLFPPTRGEAQLTVWETLYRSQSADASLEERRKMLAERLAMNPGKLSPEDFSSMLWGAGVAGELRETEDGLLVLVGKWLGISEEEALRELDEILPAHLPWTWLEDMNWVKLDAWAPDFAFLDGKGLTWEEFDGMTQEELGKLQNTEPEEFENEEEPKYGFIE